jgi:hypothetical protein
MDDIQFIVEKLNQPPFGMRLRLVSQRHGMRRAGMLGKPVLPSEARLLWELWGAMPLFYWHLRFRTVHDHYKFRLMYPCTSSDSFVDDGRWTSTRRRPLSCCRS